MEGKNIVIDWRSADGKLQRLPALAAEMVRLKLDVIVTSGASGTRAVKEATNTIPIVMTNDPDPVGDGIIASLARPGGNITGLSALAPELNGKRLEILREVVPKLSRLAVLRVSTGLVGGQMRELELAAKAFGVTLQYLDVLDSKNIETIFRAAIKGRADGVLVLSGGIISAQRAQHCRPRGKEPAPGDIPRTPVRRSRWAYVLRREPPRPGPARRYVRGQDSERRQARRSSQWSSRQNLSS